jgi:hypothetical protein
MLHVIPEEKRRDKILLQSKNRCVGRGAAIRLGKSGAEKLATRHFLLAALPRWRRLIAVTMHLHHRRLRLGSEQPAKCAMIRDRKPSKKRQQGHGTPIKFCDAPIHNASSILRNAKMFKCFPYLSTLPPSGPVLANMGSKSQMKDKARVPQRDALFARWLPY